jgi:dipeptidyl aminopeptidase/acylaminoacyl peptidase
VATRCRLRSYQTRVSQVICYQRKGIRFLGSEFNERNGRFSPDGRYVAYASDESGTNEIYVRSFPDAGGRWQVSKKGGTQPRWRKDGRQLYYLSGGTRIMSVDVTTGATFQSGDPKPLIDARVPVGYDVAADGKRFLVATTAEEGAADPITVVLNWKAALKR